MLLLLAAGCLAAQSQTASVTPAFEVASVKPAPPPDSSGMHVNSDGGPGTPRPERYTAVNLDFAGFVMYAYDIKRFQISGPDWIRTERYNVSAIVPPHATREQFRLMLQNLLAERFALKIHWENRTMPIYELAVAKGGPKLEETKPDEPVDPEQANPRTAPKSAKAPDGFPSLPDGNTPIVMMMSTRNGPAMAMRAHNETAEGIASMLSHQVNLPVRDATGLKGKYDFTLYWLVRAIDRSISAASSDPNGSPTLWSDSPGPMLFEAIQQQLGLKLEPKKGPVPIVVVDRVEKKPTAD
jgi:uncharacterized protein (TIGR03435 family)